MTTHLKSLYIPDKPRGFATDNVLQYHYLEEIGGGWGWVGYWGACEGWVDWKKRGTLSAGYGFTEM
jgi:hypothetical protein